MFTENAVRLLELGYSPLPFDGKRPLFRNWRQPLGKAAIIAAAEKHPAANVAVQCDGLIVFDIDHEDEVEAQAVAELIQSKAGRTRFARVGKHPRLALFYQGNAPTRKFGKVELRAAGAAIVTHGIHPITHKPYDWIIDDIINCPMSKLPEVDDLGGVIHALGGSSRQVLTILKGERNNKLFDYVRSLAFHVATEEELLDLARNFSCDPPLSDAEIRATVRSVWRYKEEKRLIAFGDRSTFTVPMDQHQLKHLSGEPAAVTLLMTLFRTRPREGEFMIAVRATARYLGWGTGTVQRAIRVLLEAGWLLFVGERSTGQPRPAYFYRFGTGSAVR